MLAVLPSHHPVRAPLGAIAKAFLTVSVFGFGGGIVWARRIAVEQRGWLSDAEFLDIVSLCQFLPGPNIIGIAVCTGTKLRGAHGAIAAIAGFLALPWSVGGNRGWFDVGVVSMRGFAEEAAVSVHRLVRQLRRFDAAEVRANEWVDCRRLFVGDANRSRHLQEGACVRRRDVAVPFAPRFSCRGHIEQLLLVVVEQVV